MSAEKLVLHFPLLYKSGIYYIIMDTVIFSGRISKTEILHERERWYNRLVVENRLEDYRGKDEWKKWKNIHRSFGYVFFLSD